MSEERIAELEARVAELEQERDAALAARDSIMREVLPISRVAKDGGEQPARRRSTMMLVGTFVLLGIVGLLVFRMARTAQKLGGRGSGSAARARRSRAAKGAVTAGKPAARRVASVYRPGRRSILPMSGLRHVGPLAIGPHGRLVVVGGDDGRAVLADIGTDRVVRTLSGAHHGAIRDVAFAGDGRLVLTAGADGKLVAWALSGAKVRELRAGPVTQGAGIRDIAVAAGVVALAGEDDGLELLTLDGKKRQRLPRSQSGWLRAVAVAPGAKLVAAAGEDGKVRLYGGAIGSAKAEPLREIAGHKQWVNALAFSSDGKRLASAGFEKRVIIWDVASGKRLARLRGHVRRCTSVAFGPRGRLLATASLDRTIVLWDVARAIAPGVGGDGLRRAVLRGHRYQVNSVVFDGAGRFVISSSGDGTLRFWPVALSQPPSRRLLPKPGRGELTLRGYTSGERRRIRLLDLDGSVLPAGRRELAQLLRSGPDDATKLPDEKLIKLLYKIVDHFGRWREVSVISGYRSPRFNKLRTKQSKQVAKKSRHMRGEAIDFQLEGVPIRKLHSYVKKLKAGGLGLYPDSQFIHVDVGPVRYWGGD